MTADGVVTGKGVSVKADVVVLCTGFKVQDCEYRSRSVPVPMTDVHLSLSPLPPQGLQRQGRVPPQPSQDDRCSCVPGNLRLRLPQLLPPYGTQHCHVRLLSPSDLSEHSLTTLFHSGHSSVVFTSECQITMILKLIKPILAKLDKPLTTPAPSVVVTAAAEEAYDHKLRAEMKKKVWEKDGGVSWYVDQATGLCTTLYPWSQVHFWWNTRSPPEASFKRISC